MLRTRALVCAAVAAALLAAPAAAFYLPGVAPRGYAVNEPVDMQVNKIHSVKTQLPYRYYSLPFCAPEEPEEETENLGEYLSGDRIESSLYQLRTKILERCSVLCDEQHYSPELSAAFAKRIDEEYVVDWVLDNMPAAVRIYDDDSAEPRLQRGFPLGYYEEDPPTTPDGEPVRRHYLFNHINFHILYNANEEGEDPDKVRIVGFEVEPVSIKHTYSGPSFIKDTTQLDTCNPGVDASRDAAPQPIDGDQHVIFTYNVIWQEDDTKWSERWQVFLEGTQDDEVHWFSIINSLMIVLFLTGMIAMILMRALNRDIAKYNEESTLEDSQEESGWKLVHADVFRAPKGWFGPMVLAVLVGSGVQVLMMAITLMVFAVFGFLSPANRGGLVTAMLLLFVFMGSFAGYWSARIYKMFGGKEWKRNALLTAFMFPGSVCMTAFVLNFFVWGEGSSGAIPFGTMFAVVVLWFGVSTPLVFLGSVLGFKKDAIKQPVRTNAIPRVIPPQPWYLTAVPSILVGGVLPFGAVFIELFFILSSIWLHQIYYVFGFLMLVLAILIITSAEISIVMAYFQLCSEDYNWWWRSFLTPGASALYVFLYAVMYFITRLDITNFVSGLLYFCYMGLASWAFFLMTGAVGFISCLLFVRKIYGAIKVD